MGKTAPRLLGERAIEQGIASDRETRRAPRSVTINMAESPLGWLLARGLVTRRQYDAGERLRSDWERAQLAPRVTMAWDSAPVARGRGGGALVPDLSGAQIDAKRRFDDAIAKAGPRTCRYPVAYRLRRRGDARCRNRAGLAGARGKAGVVVRPRPGR